MQVQSAEDIDPDNADLTSAFILNPDSNIAATTDSAALAAVEMCQVAAATYNIPAEALKNLVNLEPKTVRLAPFLQSTVSTVQLKNSTPIKSSALVSVCLSLSPKPQRKGKLLHGGK